MLATSTSPGPHPAEVGRPVEHPGGRGDLAGAGADAGQHVAGLLVRRRPASVLEHPVTRPARAAAAGEWPGAGRASALACDRGHGLAAVGRGRPGSPSRRSQNTSSGRSITPGGDQPPCPAPAASGAAAARPGRCRPSASSRTGAMPCAQRSSRVNTRRAAPGPAGAGARLGGPLPAVRRAALPHVRVGALAAQVEAQGVEQRGRVVGRHRRWRSPGCRRCARSGRGAAGTAPATPATPRGRRPPASACRRAAARRARPTASRPAAAASAGRSRVHPASS